MFQTGRYGSYTYLHDTKKLNHPEGASSHLRWQNDTQEELVE